MKFIFFNNFKKKEIVRKANKKLKINTKLTSIHKKKEFFLRISKKISNVAPKIAGIDKYIEYFVAQILLNPKKAIIYDNTKFGELKRALNNYDIEISSGKESVLEAAKRNVDIFVAAIVGYEGLYTTYNSMPYVKTIALANKESMVCAGNLIMERCKKYGCNINFSKTNLFL